MASAKKCDRCGKYYVINKTKRSIHECTVIGIRIVNNITNSKMYDLCDDCIDALFDFMYLDDKEEK